MTNIKIDAEATLSPDLVQSYNDHLMHGLIALQSDGLNLFGFSRVSTHLAMLSRLVGMLQAIDQGSAAKLLDAMSAIAAAQKAKDDAAHRKAQADYIAAHSAMLHSWELYFANSGNGVPA